MDHRRRSPLHFNHTRCIIDLNVTGVLVVQRGDDAGPISDPDRFCRCRLGNCESLIVLREKGDLG